MFETRVTKKPRGYQPEGCAVLAPRGMSRIVKGVYTPTHRDLEGRGLAVRFSRGLFDLVVVSMYCRLGDRDPQNRIKTERLWNWLRRVREQLPNRTVMIVGVDAHGHGGDVREWTSREWEGPRGGGSAEEY